MEGLIMTDKTDTDPAVVAVSAIIDEALWRGTSESKSDVMLREIRTAYAAQTQELIERRHFCKTQDAEKDKRIAELESREQRLVELEEENIELRRRLSKAMEF
jgi:hypothetical protein